MGYTPYQTMVLIPEGCGLTFGEVATKLKDRFAGQDGFTVRETGAETLTVVRDGWSLRVAWDASARVAVESQEIADKFVTDAAERAEVAACQVRITTAGDPDPSMKHFNDYVFVLEVLEQIPGIYLFDLQTGEVRRNT